MNAFLANDSTLPVYIHYYHPNSAQVLKKKIIYGYPRMKNAFMYCCVTWRRTCVCVHVCVCVCVCVLCVCVCACARLLYMSLSCVSTPRRNSVPPPLCVIAVMRADCRLLWCFHLSSLWPTLGIWPGLIVLMVDTGISSSGWGGPIVVRGIMKET